MHFSIAQWYRYLLVFSLFQQSRNAVRDSLGKRTCTIEVDKNNCTSEKKDIRMTRPKS